MLHREDQVHIKANQYDIVRSKIHVRVVPGVMNSYNKTVKHKDFEGYGLVTGKSEAKDTGTEIQLEKWIENY